VGIVLASVAGWSVLALLGHLQTRLLVALAGGGLVIALCGFIDDRHQREQEAQRRLHRERGSHVAWIGELTHGRAELGAVGHDRA